MRHGDSKCRGDYVSVPAVPGVTDADSPKIRMSEEDGVLIIVGHN